MLACPSCGSDDVAIEETDSGICGLRGEYYGTCWSCYVETSKESTRRKAKQAWNRRPVNKQRQKENGGAVLKPKRPKCSSCGRFMRKVYGKWMCRLMFWDYYAGAWEHD